MINPLSLVFNLLPVKQNKIVFSNFNGRGYGCNPKYITDEILQTNNKDLDIVWLSNEDPSEFPYGVRVVKWGTLRALYEWSTARVIVNNVRMGKYFSKGFIKKRKQVYIQTWHGSMGIKKMEADCNHLTEKYLHRSKCDSRNIDYLLSNSEWITKIYRRSFFYDGKILNTGNPRNDIFFKQNLNSKIKKIKKILGVNENNKILLFMPTFRDVATKNLLRDNVSSVMNELRNHLGKDWTIVLRSHPNHRMIATANDIDASDYPDPQELLLAADYLVTDYSSAAFDYLLTRKPCFLFVPDYDDYISTRGLYYPLTQTPFPIAKTTGQLIENINSFNNEKYQGAISSFLISKGSFDKGIASATVVNLIYSLLSNSKGTNQTPS